jgi:hypothetical protein
VAARALDWANFERDTAAFTAMYDHIVLVLAQSFISALFVAYLLVPCLTFTGPLVTPFHSSISPSSSTLTLLPLGET